MNKKDRKAAADLSSRVRDIIGELEALRDSEQEKFDNMPESFQSGERGEKAQAGIDSLESAIGDLENTESTLEELQQ